MSEETYTPEETNYAAIDYKAYKAPEIHLLGEKIKAGEATPEETEIYLKWNIEQEAALAASKAQAELEAAKSELLLQQADARKLQSYAELALLTDEAIKRWNDGE